ncbi:MAG TPA: thioredoxin domain-containing protein [Polyangiaceae bacterium]|nr:thioredoxin domain-containing protein [Polyangiaceae bacterium]
MTDRAPNRLAREASPYLRQHSRNPVDWFPWGSEALEKAKTEDKPILLSIGYSACHWCHVMEKESFEDGAIAAQMSDDFVSIKVDREERPDLDQIYQLVVQLMGRSGGWPLTVFLTPDQRPFFGGTYFPPRERYGMPGFPQVLRAIAEAYRNKRADVELQASELAQAIGRVGELSRRTNEPYAPGPDLLERTSKKLAQRFDEQNGGFGDRPKFPNTMCLDVLLRRGVLERDEDAARKVRRALDGMQKGGIWDHLGGGFHRYSTDERWLVPHFEKMLYDNALLLGLYTEAFRAFGSDEYAATASDIGTYLLREMQGENGGFFTAQDADSEGEEGRFFVWSKSEVESLLAGDPLASAVALAHFGVTPEGNFESTGATVLAEQASVNTVAAMLGKSVTEVGDALTRATVKMLAAREQREKPFCDQKVLASWNALAISALADASLALGEPSLLIAAEKAFDFVETSLVRGGAVNRLVKDGIVKGPGFLDDHAFLCSAALDLYEATGNPAHVLRAHQIADQIIARFWDEAGGGFFFTPSDGEKLIARSKDPFDQAIPSGGAVASRAFLKLGAMVDEKYADYARRYLEANAAAAVDNPFGFGQTIGVLDRLVRGSTDVVVLGASGDARARALHRVAYAVYAPNRNVVWVDPANADSMAAAPRFTADRRVPLGNTQRGAGAEPVAYVCRGHTCSAPVATPGELRALLAAR